MFQTCGDDGRVVLDAGRVTFALTVSCGDAELARVTVRPTRSPHGCQTESFYAGDPVPHYARLRAEAPLAWNAEVGWWAVSKHADVVAMSRDPATFCSGKGILTFEIGVEYPSPPTMMHTDPPEHTRYRKLVQPGFAPALHAGDRGVGPRREPSSWSTGSSPATPSTSCRRSRRSRCWSSPSCSASRRPTGSGSAVVGRRDPRRHRLSLDERMALLAEMHEYLLPPTKAARGAGDRTRARHHLGAGRRRGGRRGAAPTTSS